MGLCERRVKYLASSGKNTEFLEPNVLVGISPRKSVRVLLLFFPPEVKNQIFNIKRFIFSDPAPNSVAIETRNWSSDEIKEKSKIKTGHTL